MIERMKALLENSDTVAEAVAGSQLMSPSEAMGEYVKTVRDAIINNIPKKLRAEVHKGTSPASIGTVTGSGVSKTDLEATWDLIVDFNFGSETLTIHAFYKDPQLETDAEKVLHVDVNERPGKEIADIAKWFDR